MNTKLISHSAWAAECAAPVDDELFCTQPVHLGLDQGYLVAVVRDPAQSSKFHVRVYDQNHAGVRDMDIRTVTTDRWLEHMQTPALLRLLGLDPKCVVHAGMGYRDTQQRTSLFHWQVLGGDIIHGGHKQLVEDGFEAEFADGRLRCSARFMALLLALHTAAFYEEPPATFDASEPMTISYDEKADVVTICGQKFSGEFFRAFGYAEQGTWIRLDRDEDGKVIINRPGHDQQVVIDYAVKCCETVTRPDTRTAAEKLSSASIALSNRAGNAMAKALGLDGRSVRSLSIEASAGEVVRVNVLEYMLEKNTSDVLEVLRHYKLVPLDEGEENGDHSGAQES